jgi:hypothetical protein
MGLYVLNIDTDIPPDRYTFSIITISLLLFSLINLENNGKYIFENKKRKKKSRTTMQWCDQLNFI